jgi:hypothetical protein
VYIGDNQMAFSREDLERYEKAPQTKVSDKVNPFRGATPAKVATAADLTAPVAPQGAQSTLHDADESASAPAAAAHDDDTPVVDEDGSLTGDPTDSGEGTSDETSDSSTDSVDPSDESDPNADLTGETPAEEADAEPAPKKGSAAERIVEVLDLMEGYKIYGKAKEAQVAELQAELDRLRPKVAPVAVVEEKDEPMPDMSDEDVAFDNDKYRTKMAHWVKTQGRIEARRELRAAAETQAQQATNVSLNAKVAKFEEAHPDFDEKVRKNKILINNQLHPIAGRLVQKSEYTADLLYSFGSDVALAVRVAKMDPEDQVLAINDMIAKIKAKKATVKSTTPQGGAKPAQKKSITQAPPPPRATPAAGRPASRDVLDPSMSMDDFARQHRSGRQAERAQNRKQRGLS